MAFSTTTELAQYVEKELGHNLSGSTASSQRTDIVSHLDRAHKLVLAGGGFLNYDEKGYRKNQDVVFSFARATNPKIINTVAPIDTGFTVDATLSSTTITFSSDPNSGVSVQGYHIVISGGIYRISSHTAASTTATLDAAFVDTTVTGANFSLFKLQYTVGSSDVLRLLSPARTIQGKLDLLDKDELLDRYPLNEVSKAFPCHAAIINESSGTFTFQLSSYPDDIERLEFDYVAIPTTLDTTSTDPILPAQHRLVLAELACYYMLMRNDDSRAAQHLAIARQMFQALVDWNSQNTGGADSDFGRVRIGKSFGSEQDLVKVQRGYTIS